jgi:DNA topoisomerase IA
LRNPEIAIPDEILQQEKIKIYTLIYQFFLLQGVDAESYTLTELQQMIDSGKFKSDLDGARQIRDELKKAIDF